MCVCVQHCKKSKLSMKEAYGSRKIKPVHPIEVTLFFRSEFVGHVSTGV